MLIQDRDAECALTEGNILKGQAWADIEDDGDAEPWAAEVPARNWHVRRRQRQAAVRSSLPAEASDGEGSGGDSDSSLARHL